LPPSGFSHPLGGKFLLKKIKERKFISDSGFNGGDLPANSEE